MDVAELILQINRADEQQIDDLMEAVFARKRELYPPMGYSISCASQKGLEGTKTSFGNDTGNGGPISGGIW